MASLTGLKSPTNAERREGSLVAFYYGFGVIFTQSCLLREYITFCHGTEFYIASFFLMWLLFASLGALTAGVTLTKKVIPIKATLLFPLFSLPLLWLGALLVGGRVQGLVPLLSEVLAFTLLAVAPVAFLSGRSFVLLSHRIEPQTVYALEALGMTAGGILLDILFMPFLGNYMSLGMLSLFGVFVLFRGFIRYIAVVLIVLLLFLTPPIEEWVLERQELGELLEVKHTRAGRMTLRRLEGENQVYLDGVPLISSRITAEALATLAEGIGGTTLLISENPSALEAAAKRRGWKYRSLSSDAETALFLQKHLSVKITPQDVRSFVKCTGERFSVVLIESFIPSSIAANRMMSVEFFRGLSRLCDGVLVAVPEPEGAPPASYKLFLKALFNAVKEPFGKAEILKIEAAGLVITTFPKECLPSLTGITSLELSPLKKSLDELDVEANSDTNLLCVRYGLAYHCQRLEMHLFASFLMAPSSTIFGATFLLLLLPALVVVFVCKSSDTTLLFSTGAAALALQLVLLLLFQSRYGLIYGAVGALVASFMAGSALGALAAKRVPPSNRRIFLLILAYLMLIGFIALFGSTERVMKFLLFFILNGTSGFLIGLRFGLLVKRNKPSIAYGLDLIGAAAGTVASFFLLPSCGFILSLAVFLLLLSVTLFLNLLGGIGGQRITCGPF